MRLKASLLKTMILLIWMMSLTACAVDPEQSTGQSLIFTEKQSGQTVTVKEGEVITLKLNENPTTGFLWGIDKHDSLSKIFDAYTSSSRTLVGSGGIRTLKFRAEMKGTTRLSLKYWREWEGDASIVRHFQLNVSVIE